MSPPRRTPRGRTWRLDRLGDRVERAGRRGLLALWWLVAGALRLVLDGVAWVGRAGARWLGRRRPTTQVALVAGLAVAAVVAWRWHAAHRRLYPTDDVEALARVIRSEAGDSSWQQRLHVAWATRNLAAERHESIVALVCSPCGPQDASRPESSRQDASDADRALARQVLAAPCTLDPTGGATQFLDPALQDELARTGAPGYVGRPYRIVARQWRRYGWSPYYRLGSNLELWGPAHRRRALCPQSARP